MLAKFMRWLGWVRRAEHQKLLVQHVRLLDDHEKMIRLAQALLQQTGAAQNPAKRDAVDAAEPAETRTKEAKPAKLH